MNEDERYALAARVDYADAMRYAKSRGWMRADFPRMDIGIFHRGEHEAVLPMDTALGDYASAMIRFAEVLAQAEGRATERVLQDLVTPKWTVIGPRAWAPMTQAWSRRLLCSKEFNEHYSPPHARCSNRGRFIRACR